eukprot:850331-Rhodomonas_salina.2
MLDLGHGWALGASPPLPHQPYRPPGSSIRYLRAYRTAVAGCAVTTGLWQQLWLNDAAMGLCMRDMGLWLSAAAMGVWDRAMGLCARAAMGLWPSVTDGEPSPPSFFPGRMLCRLRLSCSSRSAAMPPWFRKKSSADAPYATSVPHSAYRASRLIA